VKIVSAIIAVFAIGVGAAQAQPQSTPQPKDQAKLIGPSVYDWSQGHSSKTPVGEFRQILKGPTATLNQLEVHVTTLNPGQASHPPHRHPNEELVIIRQGVVETLSGGSWKRLGPGSVIFNASNSLHALKNVGTEPAVYDVVNWEAPPKTATSKTR
jgi:uncharacterized cupin superfamily protein